MRDKKTIRTANYVAAETFISKQIERHGICVLLGDKGSGKTYIKTKVVGAMAQNVGKYKVVEVGVMNENAKTITQIMSAMITDISGETPKQDVEARRKQLRRILGTAASGYEVILAIDEAQDLHKSTLRGLKKIHELAYGTQDKLFTIILFAHPEIVVKISDDELRPRFKRFKMQPLTAEEKAKFVPDTTIFEKDALNLFLRRTRTNPLSVEESWDDLAAIKEELGIAKLTSKQIADYFSYDVKETIVGFGMSYRALANDIKLVTGKDISGTALNQVVNGKYQGAIDKVQSLIREYAEQKSQVIGG